MTAAGPGAVEAGLDDHCAGSGRVLPLDRAAHRRRLLAAGPLPVSATCLIASYSSRRALSDRRRGLRFVEPAAILQPEVGVVAEEVGRADRVVGAGDLLALVVEILEREAPSPPPSAACCRSCRRGSARRRCSRSRSCCTPDRREVAGIADQAVDHRLHVGAVVAHEHDHRALRALEVGEAVGPAVGRRQRERSCAFSPKLQTGGVAAMVTFPCARLRASRLSVASMGRPLLGAVRPAMADIWPRRWRSNLEQPPHRPAATRPRARCSPGRSSTGRARPSSRS